MPWDVQFPQPIDLPNGTVVTTLREAADYISQLPKSEQDTKEWQIASDALAQAADNAGSVWFARIGMMRALCRKNAKAVHRVRKDRRVKQGTPQAEKLTREEADLKQHLEQFCLSVPRRGT